MVPRDLYVVDDHGILRHVQRSMAERRWRSVDVPVSLPMRMTVDLSKQPPIDEPEHKRVRFDWGGTFRVGGSDMEIYVADVQTQPLARLLLEEVLVSETLTRAQARV